MRLYLRWLHSRCLPTCQLSIRDQPFTFAHCPAPAPWRQVPVERGSAPIAKKPRPHLEVLRVNEDVFHIGVVIEQVPHSRIVGISSLTIIQENTRWDFKRCKTAATGQRFMFMPNSRLYPWPGRSPGLSATSKASDKPRS